MIISERTAMAFECVSVSRLLSRYELVYEHGTSRLACGCTLLFFGRAGDVFGERLLFLIGTFWMGAL